MTKISKKPIAVICTDSHLKKDNYELVHSCFCQVKAVMKELDIKTLFHGGDFFTSRNAQPEDSLRNAKTIFELFEEEGFFQIPGNHDKTNLDSENSYLDVFDKYCTLIRDTQFVDIENVRIHLVPYFKEDVNYLNYLDKAVKNINPKMENILLTHVAVAGVRNNDGSEVDNEISLKLFKKFKHCLVGHYHNRSKVGDNVHFIGSMFAGSYGEDNEKGITVLFDDGSFEYFQLDFPHYIKVKIDASDKQALKKIETEYKDTDHHVRLIFQGERGKLESIDKTQLSDYGFDVKFEDNSVVADVDISEGELITFNKSNLKQAFVEFCKNSSIKDNKTGLKYLELI